MSTTTEFNADMEFRYENARRIMQSLWTKKGPRNTSLFPRWIGATDQFWYIRELENARKEFRLVDAQSGE